MVVNNVWADKFGLDRKVDSKQVKMPKSWISYFNAESSQIEKISAIAIIKALKEFGGPTKAKLVKEKASEYDCYTQEEREATGDSGYSVLNLHQQFAMSNLKRAGLLTSPTRGVWELTDEGRRINWETFDIWEDVYSKSIPVWEETNAKKRKQKKAAKQAAQEETSVNADVTSDAEITEIDEDEVWRKELLRKLQNMNPYKFEELVVNLLRKIGIEMALTPKSGDSGIDGICYLRTPELLTYKVVLQTKRFAKGQVTGPDISNFAGTISGNNADRGIFVTTSTYTKDAVNRSRQGANLITLINGEELIDLLFEQQMGVREKTIVVIDDQLFSEN
ncbi:restriction endonuclease [Weissella paramesenteroides]|uniref:restriction endonuclease n=1 Tax=Weissella paramesenteroides TaxID=1249 RepID=UPI003983D785